ncbi:hypothetical protein ACPV5O_02165 [Vibrio maritimus]|uniref:hypothetical protein n=1 Tax=Vibrio maritimus TaxID=990268 RepID=UPI004067E2DD
MFSKRTWQNLILIFLYTLLVGCVYQVLTFRQELSDSAERVLNQVESQLATIEDELRSIYVTNECSEEVQRTLAHHVFKSVGLRGLAVGERSSAGNVKNVYCSNFGPQTGEVDDTFWNARAQRDIVFAKLKIKQYRRDLSYALAVIGNGKIAIGTINPRIILGWWVEPMIQDTQLELFFSDGERLIIAGQRVQDDEGFESTARSERYPIMIKATQPTFVLQERMVTFFQRLVVGGLIALLALITFAVYQRITGREERDTELEVNRD